MMLYLEMWYCKDRYQNQSLSLLKIYRNQIYLKEVHVEFYVLFCLLVLKVMNTEHHFYCNLVCLVAAESRQEMS